MRPLALLLALALPACSGLPPPPPAPCISSGGLVARLPDARLALAWTHSIEKIRWEEDWRLSEGHMVLDAARVRGSGAGMEPPPGARLIDGVWHYTVARREAALVLTRSPFTEGYALCSGGRCGNLADWLPGLPEIAQVRIHACAGE